MGHESKESDHEPIDLSTFMAHLTHWLRWLTGNADARKHHKYDRCDRYYRTRVNLLENQAQNIVSWQIWWFAATIFLEQINRLLHSIGLYSFSLWSDRAKNINELFCCTFNFVQRDFVISQNRLKKWKEERNSI